MSIEIQGLNELNNALRRLAETVPSEVEEELADIALDLAGEASRKAPILNGDLRGDLAAPKKIENGWEIGSSLPYALVQHEHIEFKHPRGGEAKFLEGPFNEKQSSYLRRLEEVTRNALD